MESPVLLKFLCAFVFVIALMMVLAWVMKKIGLSGQSFIQAGKKRLKVVEVLPIDHRRKLVLVRRDDREHLLVLGGDSEAVIEANIPAAAEFVPAEAAPQTNKEA